MTNSKHTASVVTLDQAVAVLQPGGPCLRARLAELSNPATEQLLIGAARLALAESESPFHKPRAAVMPDYWLVVHAKESTDDRIRVTHAEAFLWAISIEWSPDQVRRYLDGCDRCKQALSAHPWHANRAAKDPAYWITFCASEPLKWTVRDSSDRPPPTFRAIPISKTLTD